RNTFAQLLRPATLIGAAQDERNLLLGSTTWESVNRQIAAVFRMNTAEKKEHSRFLDFRKFRKKQITRFRSGSARLFDTEGRNFLFLAIEPEGWKCSHKFFLRGQNYLHSIQRHLMTAHCPAGTLFQHIERIRSLDS